MNEPTNEPTNDPFPDPYTFCKCGKAGCPTAKTVDGGVLLEAPLAEIVETSGGRGVFFDPASATELRKWLESRGF